jgi:flagellar M-ring protein FliF
VATSDNALHGTWDRLGAVWKTGLILGTAALLAGGAWLVVRALHVEYGVLFSDLAEADAAMIVEQLQASDTSYRLASGGSSILVPAEQLLDTRLALMSSDTPLTGGVGFEIFDNQSLGATEQSQRVSYQRALQGELARTIAAFDNVKQARVHLVLPDSTLFKRDTQEPRAAITLLLKDGTALSREQILGVQRLVAASVAGLDPVRVVVVDQRGVTLSGVGDLDPASAASEVRLTTKRDVEGYITRKVVSLLDDTYGPGQAIVSVDVALNFDEIRRTVQDLLPVRAQSEGGRVLPRLQVNSGVSYDDPTWAIESGDEARVGNSSTRVEYEYGRSVEQVIAAPGGITRVTIGVIIPEVLDVESIERIRELVKIVAGVDEARGDEVVVRTLADLGGRRAASAGALVGVPAADAAAHDGSAVAGETVADAPADEASPEAGVAPLAAPPEPAAAPAAWLGPRALWIAGGGAVILLFAIAAVLLRTRRNKELSPAERQKLLEEIRRAIGDDEPADTGAKP